MATATINHILSFDVGVKNLGYAVLLADPDTRELQLVRSGLHNLGTQRGIAMLRSLLDWLGREFGEETTPGAIVLVECQMRAFMKVVATAITTYFLARGCDAHSVSPRAKLAHAGPATKYLTYAGRKQLAVDEVERLTGGWRPEGDKADDVCDAILQAYAFCATKRMVLPQSSIRLVGGVSCDA